jgi:hypothetical protein
MAVQHWICIQGRQDNAFSIFVGSIKDPRGRSQRRGRDFIALCSTKAARVFDRDAVIQHFSETAHWPAHLSEQAFFDVFPQLLQQNLDTQILNLLNQWKFEDESRLQWMLFLQTLHHNQNNVHDELLKELHAPKLWPASHCCPWMEFFNRKDVSQMTLEEAFSDHSYEFAKTWMFFQRFLKCQNHDKSVGMIKTDEFSKNRVCILFFLTNNRIFD